MASRKGYPVSMRQRLGRAVRWLAERGGGEAGGGAGGAFRKKPLLEALEQRVLLSADALTLGEVTQGLDRVTAGLSQVNITGVTHGL